MKYDVFLSKNSADQDLADAVLSFLDAAGIKVFESSRNLPNLRDSDYSKAIFDALDNSETLIIICTQNENGNKSGWVYDEWSTFINEVRSKRREGRIMTIRKGIPIKDLDPQLRKYESFEYESYQSRILPYFGKEAASQPKPVKKTIDPSPSEEPIEKAPRVRDYLDLILNKGTSPFSEQDRILCEAFVDDVRHSRVTRWGKSESRIRELAEQGFDEAEYAMGFLECPYPSTAYMGKQYDKAEYWLKLAADKGHVKACLHLAEIYFFAKESEKAIPYARVAAEKENLDAAIILYRAYSYLKRYPEYIEALRAAAELQKKTKKTNIDAPAFEYGKLLMEGKLVPKDLKSSIKWFDLAGKLPYDTSQSNRASQFKEKARKELAKSVLSSINPFKK